MTPRVLAIWKKEALVYVMNPLSYVMVALAVFFIAVLFVLVGLQDGRDASLRLVMAVYCFAFLFITPIMTMRLLAEETNRGTLELLLTSPLTPLDIIVGKFLGLMTLYGAVFVITGVFPIVLSRVSTPDYWLMASQYLGMLLCTMAFVSVGMFASSITSSQVISAVLGFILLLTIWFGGLFAEGIASMSPRISDVATAISLTAHLDNFGKGIIDAVDVFYYLAFTIGFLFLATRAVEARRWT